MTEEVRGLINYHPHWIIRKGNLFFLLILCGIFGITWCIRVPSSLSGPMQTGEKNGQLHGWIKTTRSNAAELKSLARRFFDRLHLFKPMSR